jgi:hypothetical protein
MNFPGLAAGLLLTVGAATAFAGGLSPAQITQLHTSGIPVILPSRLPPGFHVVSINVHPRTPDSFTYGYAVTYGNGREQITFRGANQFFYRSAYDPMEAAFDAPATSVLSPTKFQREPRTKCISSQDAAPVADRSKQPPKYNIEYCPQASAAAIPDGQLRVMWQSATVLP